MKDLLLKAYLSHQLDSQSSICLKIPDTIYFMGICGTAMAGLAVYLKQKGFNVLGSDQNIYPPMSLELKKARIPVFNYDENNIKDSIKLIVVGNVISSHHKEMLKAREKQIPIISFPEFLKQSLLLKTKNIVIIGTHGKSTSSALMSHVAEQTHQNPNFFIGAVANDFSSSFRVTPSPYFILEGDEYDSSFFAKRAKFFYYKPSYALLTSLEFDHADIYNNIEEIKKAFCEFVKKIPAEGCLVAYADSPYIEELLSFCSAKVLTYGSKKGDFRIGSREVNDKGQTFEVFTESKKFKLSTPLFGEHNALNTLGVFVLAYHLKWSESQILSALKNFKGLKRRMEFRFKFKGAKIFEDFAHHPTAVKASLSALRERYPHQRILALFEPRSFTSRLNVFQKDYISAFSPADLIFIAPSYNSFKIPQDKRFSIEQLVEDLKKQKKQAFKFSNFKDLEEKFKKTLKANDIAIFMSSGSFGSLLNKFLSSI
ncbi:MAG: Mur ligase family protein [Bdellovibrionaceae bacterium]|nr:Mur ligase family protein [Pseudobdellovibrionaceae bacterium]